MAILAAAAAAAAAPIIVASPNCVLLLSNGIFVVGVYLLELAMMAPTVNNLPQVNMCVGCICNCGWQVDGQV